MKYSDGDNNCTLCKTWCCMNNPNGDPKLCVLFNKNMKIENYPAQQQRFIRGGRKYLEENPGVKSMKEVRFPLEPIPGKGCEKGRGGRGRGRGGGASGRQATPIISSTGDLTVTEMLGGELNESSFDEWLNAAQGGDETRRHVHMLFASGDNAATVTTRLATSAVGCLPPPKF